MNSQKLMIATLAGVLMTVGALASGITPSARGQTNMNSTAAVVRDSSTVLLDGKTIPAMDYIHLCDATPYKIMNGHIATKLPCDANSVTPLKILVGQAPNFKSALTRPSQGVIQAWEHVYLPYRHTTGKRCNHDIAIQNPTNNPIKLPDTGTVVIGVNEIMPLSGQ